MLARFPLLIAQSELSQVADVVLHGLGREHFQQAQNPPLQIPQRDLLRN